jgi:hypothetical protein
MKAVLITLLSTLVLGGVASAQPADPYNAPYGPPPGAPIPMQAPAPMPPPPPAMPPLAGPHPMGPLRAALMERFDRNHDGRLEPQERRAAIRALRQLARQMAREDRRVAREQARVRRTIRRYDINHDGVVSPDEIPPGAARRLRPLDRNGDGWVDDADF